MFVELIEQLRCPREHEETALVVATTRTDDRHIVDGVLGCPACGAEFAITGGIAQFGAPADTPNERPDAELALRLAASLDLTDARGFAALAGRWCAQLDAIQRIADTPIVLVNPPRDVGGLPAGVVVCETRAPFAPASLRAAALGQDLAVALRESLVRAVRPGGRVVGPTSLALPSDVAELTRDDSMWVGEKQGALRLVNLSHPRTTRR